MGSGIKVLGSFSGTFFRKPGTFIQDPRNLLKKPGTFSLSMKPFQVTRNLFRDLGTISGTTETLNTFKLQYVGLTAVPGTFLDPFLEHIGVVHIACLKL